VSEEVVVTRRGQTTIPIKIRKKLGIVEGTTLSVTMRNEEIVFRKAKSTFDLAGSSKLSAGRAKELLDKVRREE
jgi:AbrB family looped-hinge helix DNA binding protein